MDPQLPDTPYSDSHCKWIPVRTSWGEVWSTLRISAWPTAFPYSLLISDIDWGVAQAFLSSFADDTRIGSHISSTEDSEALQEDLDSVYDWTARNNMDLNGDTVKSLI